MIRKQIMIDSQVKPLTLREILEKLGFIETLSGDFSFLDNPELLDSYPMTLEDAGMVYDIKPMFITKVDNEIYTDDKSNLNVFNLLRNGYRQND